MIDKTYSPLDVEDRIYNEWLARGYFHAEPRADKAPYTIVIPPPNITGQLHMGHALDNTLQDILIRWRRMQGYNALWMPGTDHASIATEAKIVEALEAEGTSKSELGREEFLRRAWEWRKLYGGRIVSQLKRLGCSCDWERERFTMDAGLSAAVTHVFVRLYEEGLIYKGERIINWCPGCGTSISDIEVEYRENDGFFWYMRYPVAGLDGEFISVATTRPETMLGDTAVAVHPDDPRYKKYVGMNVDLPLMGRVIPIIADAYVDSALGSGAVKITPAHDPNDFEIGLRHGLEQIRVIGDSAVMNENAGAYSGLSREDARKKVVGDLQALGLIEKIEKHVYNIGECQRCGTVIEPIASSQWFVSMKPLAGPAIDAVREGVTRFVPERFAKIYYNWMENIQDWCISRQLWWGHRIPAYYCDACGEVTVAESAPGPCPRCGGALRQDEDVLDTWFSSALWPFSTMGWPEDTPEYRYFYPTDVLVTGYDIIFFWVARMIFSAVRHTGKAPFKYVYIHGMLRDELGRKMSKSLGNGIDPLEIVDSYGADALRFALIIGNAPGNDLRLSEDKVKAARNFANKLWNAARFTLPHLEGCDTAPTAGGAVFDAADRWILARLNDYTREIGENLEKFELGVALQGIYDFIWDIFCDWYVEFAKPKLAANTSASFGTGACASASANVGAGANASLGAGAGAGACADAGARAGTLLTLRFVMLRSLKLLHPFMPFITEELYSAFARAPKIAGSGGLPAFLAAEGGEGSIMIGKWPEYDALLEAPAESKKISFIIEIIRAVRNIRAEMGVPPSRKINCTFVADGERAEALEEGRAYVERLASLKAFEIKAERAGASASDVTIVAGGAEAFIPLGDLVDAESEIKRLEKEAAGLEGEIRRASGKLANPGFMKKAPPAVVEEEKAKLEAYAQNLEKVERNLRRLREL